MEIICLRRIKRRIVRIAEIKPKNTETQREYENVGIIRKRRY